MNYFNPQKAICNTNKVLNYEFAINEEFVFMDAVIKYLRNNPNQEFTSSQIALLLKKELDDASYSTITEIEPKIKIINTRRWSKYCYNDTDKELINHNDGDDDKIDRSTVVIEFLKANPNKEFTSSQLAKLIISKHPEEVERKIQASTDKRLLNTKNNTERNKTIITIYEQELNGILNSGIQKIEPKIKATKKGRRYIYLFMLILIK